MDSTQVGILISLKTAGFGALSGNISSLSKLSAGLEKVGKNVTGLNEKIAKIGTLKANIDTNVGKISSELGKWQSTLATAASFVVPVKLAVDFESSMAEVKKYVDFKSEDEVKILGEQIKQLSRELGVNANELAQISASGGQLGLDSSKIADFTKLVSKIGVAFDMSGKDAGDAIALTMNNLKLGIDEIATLGDKINYLDDKMSMVKARDIINVIGRTAGSGSILGLKGDKISALASSFLSLGKAPEVASTAMNSLFNKLANIDGQDEKFKKALQSIGMDANYLKVAMARDASGGLDMFLNTLAKVDKKAQMGVLTDLFGTQFADDMGSLVNAIGQYNQAVNLVNDKGAIGSMDEAMKAKLATTKSGLERLTQSFISLGITIGDAFLPTLNLIVNGLSKVTNSIAAFTEKFPNLSKTLFGIVGGMLAIITVAPMLKILWWSMGIVISQIKIMATAFSFLASVFKKKTLLTLKLNAAYLWVAASTKTAAFFTAAWNMVCKAFAFTVSGVSKALKILVLGIKAMSLALISNPIGLILTLLAAAAAAIIMNWDKVKAFFSDFWEAIRPYWEATANFFTSIFDSVVAWWNELFGGFFDWIGEKFAWISDITSTVGDALGSAWKGTKEFFGFGDEEPKQESRQNDEGFFGSMFGEKDVPQIKQTAKALATTGGNITINLNGGFNIATSEGRFDLSEFERALTQSVKRAIQRDQFNQANTEIRE